MNEEKIRVKKVSRSKRSDNDVPPAQAGWGDQSRGYPPPPYYYPPPPPGQPPNVHHHYYYEAPRPKKGRSSKPTIAGALLILAAILGMIAGFAIISFGISAGDMDEGFDFWGMGEDGDVTGKVTFLNGTPVENATISIVNENIETLTDSDGNYILYNVPPGNYELRVEYEGYNTFVKKIYVSPSQVNMDPENNDGDNSNGNVHNFELTPGNEVIERGMHPPWAFLQGLLIFCAIITVIFSLITFVGGYYALKRRKFTIALAGAILGIFTIGGTLFAIIALFILIIAKKEFNNEVTQPQFEP
jgi:hypothetical protein